MDREWKVGDEVACKDLRGNYSIHKVAAITPSGLLKLDNKEILYPSLRRRGGSSWTQLSYHEVTDEIRSKARRQSLVQEFMLASWGNLPTSTLEAVRETLRRCKAEADAAAK